MGLTRITFLALPTSRCRYEFLLPFSSRGARIAPSVCRVSRSHILLPLVLAACLPRTYTSFGVTVFVKIFPVPAAVNRARPRAARYLSRRPVDFITLPVVCRTLRDLVRHGFVSSFTAPCVTTRARGLFPFTIHRFRTRVHAFRSAARER